MSTKQKKRKIRIYSPQFKAAALASLESAGGNAPAVAKRLGIPVRTLRHWAAGVGVRGVTSELKEEARGTLADRLESIAWQLLEGVTPAKIRATSVRGCLIGAAVAIDKFRLLRGEATSIHQERTVDELRQTILHKLRPAENFHINGEEIPNDAAGDNHAV